MHKGKYEDIDRQLLALGQVPPPAQLSAMILRYAGERVTLGNADALLEALGHPLPPMPPRLQRTLVDVETPTRGDQERAGVDAVLAAVAHAPAVAPAEPAARSHEALPKPRERFPWESEPARASVQAQQAGAEISVPPASVPDFDALFDSDASMAPSAPLVASPLSRAPPLPPRQRHDTVEYVPSAAPRLASISALEPGASVAPSVEARADRDSEGPEMSVSNDSGDEFEILVDDEILEIDEDEEPGTPGGDEQA